MFLVSKNISKTRNRMASLSEFVKQRVFSSLEEYIDDLVIRTISIRQLMIAKDIGHWETEDRQKEWMKKVCEWEVRNTRPENASDDWKAPDPPESWDMLMTPMRMREERLKGLFLMKCIDKVLAGDVSNLTFSSTGQSIQPDELRKILREQMMAFDDGARPSSLFSGQSYSVEHHRMIVRNI